MTARDRRPDPSETCPIVTLELASDVRLLRTIAVVPLLLAVAMGVGEGVVLAHELGWRDGLIFGFLLFAVLATLLLVQLTWWRRRLSGNAYRIAGQDLQIVRRSVVTSTFACTDVFDITLEGDLTSRSLLFTGASVGGLPRLTVFSDHQVVGPPVLCRGDEAREAVSAFKRALGEARAR